MTKQTLRNFALSLGLLGLASIPSTSLAQVGPASRFPGRSPATAAEQVAGHQAQSPGSSDLSLTFGMVDFPGQTDSGGSAANDKNEIVGGYGPNMIGDSVSNHGFLLKGTKFTEIDYPGAAYTEPNGINDSGAIVGQYGVSFSDEQGFKLVGKTYTSIDYPGASLTSANAINKSGDIVGYQYSGGTGHGFLFSKGVFTSIDVPGAIGTDAYGINKTGEIVGGYGEVTTINGASYSWEHAYVYEGGQFTNADVPFGPPAVTQPFSISNNGVIVGEYVDNSGTVYGYEAAVAQ